LDPEQINATLNIYLEHREEKEYEEERKGRREEMRKGGKEGGLL